MSTSGVDVHETSPLEPHVSIRRASRSDRDPDSRRASVVNRRSTSVQPLSLDSRVNRVFFVLGSAVLLPWNALITATPYFLSRLEGSGYKSTFNSYLSVTFTTSNFAFLAHATYGSSKTASNSAPLIRKATAALIALFFLLAISPILPLSPGLFFAFVILNGCLQACAGAYLQTAVVSTASLFGPQAIQNTFTGQAAIGVVVSLVQYISASVSTRKNQPEASFAEDGSLSLSAFLFFSMATGFLIFTLGVHAYLVRLPTYQDIIRPLDQNKGMIVEEEALTPEEDEDGEYEHEPFLAGSIELQAPGEVGVLHIAKLNFMYNFTVCYVFVVTLSIFPPITSSILSVHPDSSWKFLSSPALFITLHFLIFNIFDWMGRYLCSFPSLLIWSRKRLLTLSLARTLFIPAFLACNVSRPILPLPIPPSLSSLLVSTSTPLINSDIIYFLLLASFGLSNGYTSSMTMMAASSLAFNPRLKKETVDIAAAVAQFCLVGGLAVGSALSFGVKATICNCNPFRG